MREDTRQTTPDAAFDLRRLCRYFSERSSQPMIAVEGTAYVVRHVNDAFLRLSGRTRGELMGRPFAEAVPEEKANDCLLLLDRVFRTGRPEDLAEQRHGRAPTVYWSYAVWPILGGDERPVGLMIQVTEATEAAVFRGRAAAMNEALLLSSLRQRELAEEAGAMSAGLQAAITVKDQFLAALSHELRTPLSPVLATASMLRDDPRFDADTREHLDVICRNVELEVRLIDDLLDMTRIERGKVELDKKPVELGTVIGQAVDVCTADIEARKLEFGVDAPDGPYWVEADAARLQQVFWNLLKNAIKFTPVGGCVGVRCRKDGDGQVMVQVSDSGGGIEGEALGRIFNAFEQAERSITRQFGGLGLGLTISKGLVEMHGGSIHAHSEGKGKGASFTVRLPLLPAEAVVGLAPMTPEASLPAAPTRPLRILLVEDHGDTARIMRRLLEADGHGVRTAADVAMALQLVAEHPFDLLVSDLGLPDGSGIDLMLAIRAKGLTFPGIALSGYGQERDIQQSRKAGFVAHLTKPVSLRRLEDAIARFAGT